VKDQFVKRTRGFTLVELIVVIVLVGAIAGILVMQLRPALQSYLSVGRRANLVSQADAALHRIVADVHAAVPNSLRLVPGLASGASCLELIPTSGGGRYRTAADPDASVDSQAFDPQDPGKPFDVMTDTDAAKGDIFVTGNDNGGDVYAGVNRAPILNVAAAPAAAGRARITLDQTAAFPAGNESGRFLVVPAAQQVVSYICMPDAAGTTGTLRRAVRPLDPDTSCKADKNAPVLATRVRDCAFVYSPNGGATQQSGYLQLRLELFDSGERAALSMGAHVENVP
jgi:MSHA biogenesis protein MshO